MQQTVQTSQSILLIRPSNFGFNPETVATNAFQIKASDNHDATHEEALAEFDTFAETLKSKGVNVFIFDDTEFPEKPDAIFPNNWVTFHSDGRVILYPMFASNRRLERRLDIIDSLKNDFKVSNVFDLSEYEKTNRFLEGTGSIVFDRVNRNAYACLSPRTDEALFFKVCDHLNYEPVCFHSHDRDGKEIYHTNVMMCIGDKFAVVCLDSITNERERQRVSSYLIETEHEIIGITFEQMNDFAGNMLALRTNTGGNIVALSQRSFDSLKANQILSIEKYCEMVPLQISTIETIGGGSARCLIAEIFLESTD